MLSPSGSPIWATHPYLERPANARSTYTYIHVYARVFRNTDIGFPVRAALAYVCVGACARAMRKGWRAEP